MSYKFQQWGFVDAIDVKSEAALQTLEQQMAKFYNQAASNQDYWLHAESGNEFWKPQTHPYQCHLKTLIENGSTVIDFGCGSAHPAHNLREKNIQYIGIDWSEQQIQANCSKYPESHFICGDITAERGFDNADWAVSFFTLEHCVRPQLLLQRMYASIKPGGKVAIICPNLFSGMNSLKSGFEATTKRAKLRKLQLLDVLYSYYQERLVWPKRLQAIHQSSIQFPIYLSPRCLEAAFYADNDAVYLVTESKVINYFEQLGGELIYSSASFKNSSGSESLMLYLVIQKPLTI